MARRQYRPQKQKSSLPMVLLLLTPAVGAAVYLAYVAGRSEGATEQESTAKATPNRSAANNTNPFVEPFVGVDLPDRSPTGYGRATDDRYTRWTRLCSDTEWWVAVDEVRQANVKLDEAERLHTREDPSWRDLARQGKHLLDAALDRTDPLDDRLDELVSSARERQDWRDVRSSWRRRAIDLHKTVGG